MLRQLHLIPAERWEKKVSNFVWKIFSSLQLTFSWISDVLCASQNATVATSLRIGISIEQSLPSNKATNGRDAIGPFELPMGPLDLPLPGWSILARLFIISCFWLQFLRAALSLSQPMMIRRGFGFDF